MKMKFNKIIIITLFMFVLLVSSASASLTDGLVSYYKFDEGSGTTAYDSLKINNGTISGASWATGKINGGLDFDGTNDDVNLGNLFPTNANYISLSVWVKLDTAVSGTETILGQWNSAPYSQFFITSTGVVGVYFYYTSAVNQLYVRTTNPAITDTNFHHIVFIQTGAGTGQIWVDGVSKAVTTTNAGTTRTYGSHNLYLGSINDGINYFDGTLDEVSIYDTALSADKILEIYNSGAGLQYPFTTEQFTITTNLNDYNVTITPNIYSDYVNIENVSIADFEIEGTTTKIIKDKVGTYYTSDLEQVPSTCVNYAYDESEGITFKWVNESLGNYEIYCKNETSNWVYVTYFTDVSGGFDISLYYKIVMPINSDSDTLITHLNLTDETLYNITISATNYETQTYTDYNISLNGSISTTLIPLTKVNFTATNIWGYSVDSFNVTYGGVTYTNDELISIGTGAGEYTFLFSRNDYISMNQSFNLTATEQTKQFTNVYQTNVTIDLQDILTNTTINENGVYSFNYLGVNHSYNITNGTTWFKGLYGNYIDLFMTTDTYYNHYPSDEIIENSTHNLVYKLYKDRSVWFYLKSFSEGADLSNYSISVYSETNVYNGSTTGNVIRINNITAGTYSVTYFKTGYTNVNYFITIENKSHQTLTGYMVNESLSNYASTIFNIENVVTSGSIYGATISMYKLINSEWVLVASRSSDITGRASFGFLTQLEYKFVITKTGYEQREFLLMPLYTTYTIKLTPTETPYTQYNTNWAYYLSNNGIFYNNQLNTFDVSLSSGKGTFENYDVTITNYDGTNQSITCTNAYGCSDEVNLSVIATSYSDVIKITLDVKESGLTTKTFVYSYTISDFYLNNTLYSWKDITATAGIGGLEKGMLYTLITIIMVGVIAFVSVSVGVPVMITSGLTFALITYTFAYIDFISFYIAHLIGLGVLLIIFFSRGATN